MELKDSNRDEFENEDFKENHHAWDADSRTERVRKIINFEFSVPIYSIKDGRVTVIFKQALMKILCSKGFHWNFLNSQNMSL